MGEQGRGWRRRGPRRDWERSLSSGFHIRIQEGTVNVKREACFTGWVGEVYSDLMNTL